MKQKQEMVLMKQDQLQSTLHGETTPCEMPPVLMHDTTTSFANPAISPVHNTKALSEADSA